MTDLAWPCRLDSTGQFVTHPHGSVAAITDHAALTLATRPRERPLAPDFGIPPATGRRTIDASETEAVLDRWVPDARVVGITTTITTDGQLTVNMPIEEVTGG